jgi:hypothetical protein
MKFDYEWQTKIDVGIDSAFYPIKVNCSDHFQVHRYFFQSCEKKNLIILGTCRKF